jgi:hypothetical protein
VLEVVEYEKHLALGDVPTQSLRCVGGVIRERRQALRDRFRDQLWFEDRCE